MADIEYRNGVREARREINWTIVAVVPTILLLISLAVGLGWFGRAEQLVQNKVFAPKEEQVRHDVFKNSQAYTDGMVAELQQYMLEYHKAGPDHKAALRTVIIRQSTKVDERYLPSDLASFIRQMKAEEMAPTSLQSFNQK